MRSLHGWVIDLLIRDRDTCARANYVDTTAAGIGVVLLRVGPTDVWDAKSMEG